MLLWLSHDVTVAVVACMSQVEASYKVLEVHHEVGKLESSQFYTYASKARAGRTEGRMQWRVQQPPATCKGACEQISDLRVSSHHRS